MTSAARAAQRRRADGGRASCRTSAVDILKRARSGTAHQNRQTARAGDDECEALADVDGFADHRRSGFPGYESEDWNGLIAPAKTLIRGYIVILRGRNRPVAELRERQLRGSEVGRQ